ncbi:MAG TPA: hypothetical protein VJS47_05915 [Rhizomicrobium sp.]|nr:hypothetical protein [Rhizomicrobium sp.]
MTAIANPTAVSGVKGVLAVTPPAPTGAKGLTDLSTPFQLAALVGGLRPTQLTQSSAWSGEGAQAAANWFTSDAWLAEMLATIRSFRNVEAGWDGENSRAPAAETLDAAEMLLAYFRNAPADRRPAINVGSDGLPSFARNLRDFYLHLVVEPRNHPSNCVAHLTWYAIKDGENIFEESVPFYGTSLPPELSKLVDLK